MVEEHVQTLQVSVENWLLVGVKIVDSLGDVKSKLLAVLPRHFDLGIVQQTPERPSRAVFQDDAEVWSLCASTQEEHDVWMPNDLHDCAFVLELFQLVLLDNLLLDFFDCNCGILPTTSVDNSVATFRQLAIIMKLVEWDFVVLVEDPVLVHHVHEALVLIHNACSYLLFDILSVCSRLFKFT